MTTFEPAAIDTVVRAIRGLLTAREAVRGHLPLFSVETRRSWKDLEREIDVKLQDVERRIAEDGEAAAQVALARASEMRQSLEALVRAHTERPVHTIMSVDVSTCSPEDTLDRAARIMWERDCGVVPVVDGGGKLVGIVTDRDICMASYTRDERIRNCNVESTMSRDLHACSPSDSIQEVVRVMSLHQVRRLPVTEPNGKLVGIVSLADLAKSLNSLPSEHPARVLLLPMLAAVSERRDP